MFAFARTFAISLAVTCVTAQDPFQIYNQTQRLPDGCIDGYTAGSDTVIYTVPYTYKQVLSIIGSFKNLTWSGNPDDTVTLNGTDNTVGTARTYETAGARVVETLTLYMKPTAGPYAEIHTLAPYTLQSLNLSFYSDYDANFAGPTCNGAATLFNETVHFCATNATQAAGVFHNVHLRDVTTVGKLLGGQNFTSCAALSNSTSTNSTSNATSTNTAALSRATSSKVASSVPSSTVPTTPTQPPSAPKATTSPVSSTGEGTSLVGSAVIAGVVALAAVFF